MSERRNSQSENYIQRKRRDSQTADEPPEGFGTHEIHIRELIKNNPDVSPFLIRKWEKIFTLTFDQNASHEIDWSDFYICLRNIRDIYGPESKRTEYARKALEALWEGLQDLADSNNDELITIEEWIKLLKKSNKAKTRDRWFTDYAKFMFKLFNVSEGGWDMNIHEYSDGMAVYGHGLQEAHESFQKFAVDSEGNPKEFISFEEWQKLFFELFFSADESDRGNCLFGDLDAERPTEMGNYIASKRMSIDELPQISEILKERI